MKRITIIGSKDVDGKNDPQIFANQLRRDGLEVEIVHLEDIVFHINTGNVDVMVNSKPILDSNSALIFCMGWYKSGSKSIYKEVAYTLALYFEFNNIEFWNSEMLNQRSTGKLSTMMILALHNINIPRTVYSLNGNNLREDMTFPRVIKASAASRGRSNYLVKNQSQLPQDFYSLPNVYLLQEYIKNDYDLRAICFNSKPELVLKRSRPPESKTHLNNTSVGGDAAWMDLKSVSSEILTKSHEISKIMKREVCGIDFLPINNGQSGYACLEVNALPQLTSGFDSEHKIKTFSKIIQSIKDKDENSVTH